MPDARSAILTRLRAGAPATVTPPDEDFAPVAGIGMGGEERLARLRRAMEAVHTEFLDARGADWVPAIHAWMVAQSLPSLILAPRTEPGRRIAERWPGLGAGPRLIPYDRPLAEWKAALFAENGAGLTATLGGIAATGSLILIPSADEPRTLSLVPPVHIALLEVARIYDTMWQAMREQEWSRAMPTNLLLISGPSKTADIEQTLAYGVHGPKRLLVVLV